MSIYASLEAPDDSQHENGCGGWKQENGCWEFVGPCDCGQPDAPLVYQGSHVLPTDTDPRGGNVSLACIPGYVRYYRENPGGDGEEGLSPEPFLRFGVNDATVVLTRRNVEQVYATLGRWLEMTEPSR